MTPTPTLREYETQLVALHREMGAGRGDGEVADGVRDALDVVWARLGVDERALAADLSEDLFLVEGKGRRPARAPAPEDDAAFRTAYQALEVGDAARSLELLRGLPATELFDDARFAFWLGRCWSHLGFHRAAAIFFEFVEARRPGVGIATYGLRELYEAGLYEEVVERIARLEGAAGATPGDLLFAAATLLSLSGHADDEVAIEMIRRVVALPSRVIEEPAVSAELRTDALVIRAFARARGGDLTGALADADEALGLSKTELGYVTRGMMHSQAGDRTAALADFREAVDRGTRFYWAYAALAHSALVERDYAAVRKLAAEGAKFAPPGSERAQMLEWRAIAEAELGTGRAQVESLFERARTEDPSASTAVTNESLFLRGASRVGTAWAIRAGAPPPSAIDALLAGLMAA